MRMTDQRRVIARVLSSATDHPDVEELHRRAHAVDPHISIATVYTGPATTLHVSWSASEWTLNATDQAAEVNTVDLTAIKVDDLHRS